VTALVAPSATCIIEIASLALRTAWFSPRTCEVIFELIAKPAASSSALLIRKPLDSRCIDRAIVDSVLFTALAATSELILVFIFTPLNEPLSS